jgi:hypothetical protein
MIPTEIRKPYLRRSGPGTVAASSWLDAIDHRPALRRDGGSRHTARGQRKVRCAPTAMRHKFAAVTLAAAGLGLAACSTHAARTSAQPASSANRPAMSASVAPTHPAPRPMAGTQPYSTDTGPCAEEQGWGIGPQDGGTAMTPAPIYLARAGQHECYDRVVFDINGPAVVGYTAKYVPVVRADASGAPVPVEGRAALQISVRGPIYGTDSQGHQPWRPPPAVGQNVIAPATVAGWASLTEVRFAGSFEGQTTFAVGVIDQRPFRVSTTSEQYYRHVVVDIAH